MWVILSFLAAFFESVKDVLSKKNIETVDLYVVAWLLRLFALVFVCPLLFFTEFPDELNNSFWLALCVGGSFNVLITLIYLCALKNSDLSTSVPMLNFTPMFMILTSPLMINEYVGISGCLGILAIATGTYILNLENKNANLLDPFRSFYRNKGARIMLLIALLWSFTANIDKIGIQNSSPVIWAFTLLLFHVIFLFPVFFLKSKHQMKQIKKNWKQLVLMGLASALSIIFYVISVNIAVVAYVIAIKRTSTAMSVMYGHFIFHEKHFKYRIIGAILMIIGAAAIIYSSR